MLGSLRIENFSMFHFYIMLERKRSKVSLFKVQRGILWAGVCSVGQADSVIYVT